MTWSRQTRRTFFGTAAGFCLLTARGGRAEAGACDPTVAVDALKAFAANTPKTLLLSSALTLYRDDGEVKQELIEYHAPPRRVRLEYRSKGTVAVTGVHGDDAWRITRNGPVPADRSHFVVLERIRDLAHLHALRVAEDAVVECTVGAPQGQQRLLVIRPDGEMLQLDVELASGKLRRYSGASPSTGKADVIEVELDAWHKVDGHWVAYDVTTKLNGKVFAHAMVGHAKVGMPLNEALFRRPDGVVGPPSRGL